VSCFRYPRELALKIVCSRSLVRGPLTSNTVTRESRKVSFAVRERQRKRMQMFPVD
jgi:hypothetical protein